MAQDRGEPGQNRPFTPRDKSMAGVPFGEQADPLAVYLIKNFEPPGTGLTDGIGKDRLPLISGLSSLLGDSKRNLESKLKAPFPKITFRQDVLPSGQGEVDESKIINISPLRGKFDFLDTPTIYEDSIIPVDGATGRRFDRQVGTPMTTWETIEDQAIPLIEPRATWKDPEASRLTRFAEFTGPPEVQYKIISEERTPRHKGERLKEIKSIFPGNTGVTEKDTTTSDPEVRTRPWRKKLTVPTDTMIIDGVEYYREDSQLKMREVKDDK